ncbi:MAG TPA: extracellular solute-binding protein, partial [Anaerolineae bacterium]|nr:extracellular solute-binding protein [Anaerolineae bacterium]
MRKLFVFSLMLLLLLAACGGSQKPAETPEPADTTGEEAAPEPTKASEPTAAPSEGIADEGEAMAESFLDRAKAGEFAGTELTVFGKWTEAEGDNFVAAIEPFEEATDIDVIYEGSSEFETLITVRVEGGDAPDVAGFPQPALMAQFAKDGELVNLGEQLDTDKIRENYSDAWINLGTVNDELVGLFYRASTKSIVWYPVAAFEEAGYEVPQTWDEMLALSDTIVEEQGVTPWCISI